MKTKMDLLKLAKETAGQCWTFRLPKQPKPDGSGKGTFGGSKKTLPDGVAKKE